MLVMVLMSQIGYTAPGNVQNSAQVVERANKLYISGKFYKAVILYRKALLRGAPPIATSINIGNCYYRLQKLPEAAASFRKAVRYSEGSNTTALFNLAGVLYHLKQYGESIAVYHRALDLDPENIGAWLYIAEAYAKTEDFVGAQRALEKALKLEPEDVTIVYQLAEVHVSLQEFERAIELVREAYRRNPEEVDYLYYMGDLYRMSGNLDLAASVYKEGVSIEPDNHEVLYKLADVLTRSEKPFLAMEYLQKALIAKPDFTDASIFLGNLAYDAEWWDRAEEYYIKAAPTSVEGVQGLKNLAYEFENKGELEVSLRLLEKALSYAPNDRMLINELREFNVRKSEFEEG